MPEQGEQGEQGVAQSAWRSIEQCIINNKEFRDWLEFFITNYFQ